MVGVELRLRVLAQEVGQVLTTLVPLERKAKVIAEEEVRAA